MPQRKVIVDGSNLATEGRTLPSLAQLDEAVRAFRAEHPDDEIIVVVDASFEYRVDSSEKKAYEEAELAGEIVSPPAGAIGRGDGFLLQIADRTNAVVLSNDSFQEFHGEYEWLFNKGRLIGGKPVPGVGWFFTPRTPVRGPKSRVAVKEAKRSKARVGSPEASKPMPVPKTPPPKAKPAKAKPAKSSKKMTHAIAEATAEAIAPGVGSKRRPRRRGGSGANRPPAEPVNEPLPFIQFIADHPVGTEVEAEVDGFTSHGAFVKVGEARCYVPLTGLGDPPPRAAREVLKKGERRRFVVQALDPPRRGIEMALPGLARVAGEPTAETVEVEITEAHPPPRKKAARKKAAQKQPAQKKPAQKKPAQKKPAAPKPKKAAAPGTKKAAPPKKAALKKAAAPGKKKAAAPKKAATPTKAAVKKEAPAKKVTANKVTAKKAAKASKKAAAKRGA
jgi:hypothetical protein